MPNHNDIPEEHKQAIMMLSYDAAKALLDAVEDTGLSLRHRASVCLTACTIALDAVSRLTGMTPEQVAAAVRGGMEAAAAKRAEEASRAAS